MSSFVKAEATSVTATAALAAPSPAPVAEQGASVASIAASASSAATGSAAAAAAFGGKPLMNEREHERVKAVQASEASHLTSASTFEDPALKLYGPA